MIGQLLWKMNKATRKPDTKATAAIQVGLLILLLLLFVLLL